MGGSGYPLRHITLLFILSILFLGYVFPTQASPQQERLAVFVVMDASGSLKQTDPRGARKIAAEIFMNLLEPTDMISIIEFDKDARVLLPLVAVSEKKRAKEIIEKIGETGLFTDFRKALDMTSKELERVKDRDISKIVVFFTDGILEPDLTDSIYKPYNQDYLKEIGQAKQASERRTINNKFTDLVIPKTERIIHEEILPGIIEKGAEVYAIALTDKANTNLLKDIVEKTTKHPEENHFFLANSYRDLTKQFIKVLGCRRPIFIAYEKDGIAKGPHRETIFLDPYIKDVNFSLIAEARGIDVGLTMPSGKKIPHSTEIGGVFYDFSDLQFESGGWAVDLSGEGAFTLLAMAKSKIGIDVKGLRKTYKCKDPVEFAIRLLSEGKFLTEQDFGSLDFLIHIQDPLGKNVESKAQKQKGDFNFLYNPPAQGNYHLSVELRAKDKQSREILPRPSKELSFYVEQNWMVSPKEIYFGDHLFRGKEIVKKVDIESCLQEEIDIRAEATNIICSNRSFDPNMKGRIPGLSIDKLTLSSTGRKTVDVKLSLPPKAYRGDYKGEIRFASSKTDPQMITFRLHVYTHWEMLRRVLPVLVGFFSAIILYLVYIWGYLGSPSGVLIPLKDPTSDLLAPIKLSQVRRGFLSRWFNWRRNRLRIKKRGAEIDLSALSSKVHVDLKFYRGGRVNIKNQSGKESTETISIEEPGIKATLVRGPGKSLSLKHKSVITFGGYQFRFEKV